MTNITSEQDGIPTKLPIAQRVINIIVDKGQIEPDTIDHDSTFTELGFDSLDLVELIMAFEKEFNMPISDEEARGLSTVGDVIKFIESK